jgi:hypothetical protein
MTANVWLLGSLAGHRRGRFLGDLLGAQAAEEMPSTTGICLAFAGDFQGGEAGHQERWLTWAHTPGRTLLLLPPLKLGDFTRPVEWKVEQVAEPCVAPAGTLPGLLGPEVRHRLTGLLQVPDKSAGRWDNGPAHTGYYRRHPHAGIFAVSCLPLWSAALVGRASLVEEWLGQLHELAGTPSADQEEKAEEEFTPSPDYYAVLLHLCSGRFVNREEALEALAGSRLFNLPRERAEVVLAELEGHDLTKQGALTEAGRSLLKSSPYAAYAEALEADPT